METEQFNNSLVVRFARPQQRNPLSVEVIDRLHQIIDALSASVNINKLIITGAEDSFASGANLREIGALSPDTAREFAVRGQALMTKIANLPIITIAAINGFCFGGGLDLALSCSVRIACRWAVFSHPGVGLGIITGWGGTQRLPRLVGEANALEMLLTAGRVSADEAVRIGLVDKIETDVLRAALEYELVSS